MSQSVLLLVLSVFLFASAISALTLDSRLNKLQQTIMPIREPEAAPCVFGTYDFSSLNQTELYGFDQNKQFYYILRLCGRVNDPVCTADKLTNNSMLCQVQTNNTKMVYNIASDAVAGMTWSYINTTNTSAGAKLTMTNGDMCGGVMQRTMIALFTCGAQSMNFTVQTSALGEPEGDCTYTLHVPTPLACGHGDQQINKLNTPHRLPLLDNAVRRRKAATTN